jgi:rare lipoprotein A (peptidoglycan hydrolase)
MSPDLEVCVKVRDGMRRLVLALGTLGVTALTVASLAIAGGTGTAEAAPSVEVALGVGERTVAVAVETPSAEAKAETLLASGETLGDALAEPAARTVTPIPKPKPRPTAPARSSASSRGSASTSGSGWKTARCSWYGPGFYGNTMAGGGTLTTSSMVVAHRSMAFGTRIQFEYKGRTCTAVVQDRGPYIGGRVFDLGPGVAKALGFSGVGDVRYRIL